ncbi:hypothetical protein BGZ76_006596, partial [Entomortierella beljakovae]
MKEYKLKPWKAIPDKPIDTTDTNKSDKKKSQPSQYNPKDPKNMMRPGLVKSMLYQHPLVTLDVGTLALNARNAVDEDLAREVTERLKLAVRTAGDVKRKCQQLIGCYIEFLFEKGKFCEDKDRPLLDSICPRISKSVTSSEDAMEEEEMENAQNQSEEDKRAPLNFILPLLKYLYSGNIPRFKPAEMFIARVEELGILEKGRSKGDINVFMCFTPSSLLRSTASSLSTELKKLYIRGTWELHEKIRRRMNKGSISKELKIDIQGWKMSPISSSQQPFVSFTEGELIEVFWKNDRIHKAMLDLAEANPE